MDNFNEPFVLIPLPLNNEPNVAERLLKAIMSLDYGNYEVVVVDDSRRGVSFTLAQTIRC